jgi:uncharacterized protein YjiS (DUF1127 family)
LRSFGSPNFGARPVVPHDLDSVAAERDPSDRLVTRSGDNGRRAHDRAFLDLQESSIDDARRIPMLLSLIQMIRAFRNYQRTVAELSELSDRELADIGLNRSDTPRVEAANVAADEFSSRLNEEDGARIVSTAPISNHSDRHFYQGSGHSPHQRRG